MTFNDPNYQFIKITAGALGTIGLYSLLYRETKIYRFFEHLYLGLAAGWSITQLWTEVLKANWWDKLVGNHADKGLEAHDGNWAWILVLPVGFMAYLIFSKKHNWMSRIPIGLLIGLGAGQQIQNWFNLYGPQVENSIKPLVPTTNVMLVPTKTGLTPDKIKEITDNVYASQAINNAVFLVTLLCVLSYFIFCTEFKNVYLKSMSNFGRLVLMVGFGAIFGTTIMTRFALLIDRMYFVWVEWLLESLPRMLHGG